MIPASLRDPSFVFDSRWHTYRYGSRRLTSASRLVKQYKRPFDADAAAARVAAREGKSAAEVKAAWAAKGDYSRALGKKVHAAIEGVLLRAQGEGASLGSYVAAHPSVVLDDEDAQSRVDAFLRLCQGRLSDMEVLAVELPVFSLRYGCAGTLDTVLLHRPTSKVYLFDWKTNERFRTGGEGFGTLLEPFSDLAENELNEYAIQVACYRLCTQEHGLDTHGGFVVHLGPGGFDADVYQAPDLRKRLAQALTGGF